MRSRVLRVVGLVSVGVLLVGCTYATEEPGLLGQTPAPTSGPWPSTMEPPSTPATNPALPVLGEQVWTSADGLGVQVRIAVHALRRISGATVLDWSVTPLKAPNLRPGDAVPPTLDLGLSRRDDQRPRIYLLDSRDDQLYRPLVSATGRPRCVCTPLSPAQRRLRIGHTTLLQVAFPALPAATSAIDVVIATVPPFGQVPVTRAGHIPVAAQPTELARPGAPAPESGVSSDMFRYGPGEQIFRIQPNRVLASSTFTTLEWTIRSVTGGAGLDAASSPPFAEPDAAGAEPADPVTASGPVLVVGTGRATEPCGPGWSRFDGPDPRARGMSLQSAAGVDVGAESAGQGRHRGDDLPTAPGRHRARPGPLPRGGHHVGAGHAGAERAQPRQRNARVLADDLAARRPAFRVCVDV